MKMIKTLMVGAAVVGITGIASAVPSSPGLYIVDTATGMTGYAPIGAGHVANFVGTVGDYSVNISATGITIAGGSSPILDLDVASAIAGANATTLQVYYSDGTFGPTSGGYVLATTGPAVGSVHTSAGYSSTVFGNASNLGGSDDTFPYTVNATGTLVANNYYLTIEDLITGSETSVDSKLSVPDGGTTAMLLGIALSGVALLRRKLTA